MIVTNIELNNFGGHAHLNFSPGDDPVVGVVGKNGSGKSTLLEAVKFAFTGKLELKSEAYMRDGGIFGAAVVSLSFKKGDQVGVITRKITKTTSTRSLIMSGMEKPVTSAKEVDSIMSGLLGADRRAAVEAVFVPQGTLQNLLFADATEREVMMQRMIGCAHFATVSANADKMANQLRGTITDVTSQLAEANANLLTYSKRHDETVATLPVDSSHALSTLRAMLDAYSGNQEAVSRYQAGMGVLRGLLDLPQTQTPPHLDYVAWCQTARAELQRLTGLLQQQKEAQITARRDVERIENTLRERETLHGMDSRIPALQADVEAKPDQQAALEQARERYQVLTVKQRHIEAEIASVDETRRLHALLDGLRQQSVVQDAAVASAEASVVAAQQALDVEQSKEADYQLLRESLAVARTTSNMLGTILATPHQHLGACPLCETKSDKFDTESLRIRQQQAQAVIASSTRLIASADEKRMAAESALLRAKGNHMQARSQADVTRAKLESTPVPGAAKDTTALEAELADVRHEITLVSALGTALRAGQEQHLQAKANYTALIDGIKRLSENWLEIEASVRMRTTEMMRQDLETAKAFERGTAQDVANTTQAGTTGTATLNSVEGALVGVTAAYARQISIPADFNPEATRLEADRLSEQCTQFRAVQAALAEIQRSITAQQETVTRLEAIQQRNSNVLRCVADLDTVAGLFGRTGVARDYMNDVFSRVLVVTQHNLGRMGADFTVRPCEGPMAFEFIRNSSETGTWLVQKQMSGGQRVRMGVAFLMALQQTVLPEVGMLVLDEPTTHLDAEGREGLRDLLLGLRNHLQSGTAQFWVCDHSAELRQAFSTKLDLTAQTA